MTAHGLDGNPVGYRHLVLLTKVVNLREKVTVGLVGVSYGLMTSNDEDAMKGVDN